MATAQVKSTSLPEVRDMSPQGPKLPTSRHGEGVTSTSHSNPDRPGMHPKKPHSIQRPVNRTSVLVPALKPHHARPPGSSSSSTHPRKPRPPNTRVTYSSPPYAPDVLTPSAIGFSGATAAYTVTRNEITILASDANPRRVPHSGAHFDQQGREFKFSCIIPPVGSNNDGNAGRAHPLDGVEVRAEEHWRSVVGTYIAAAMFGQKNRLGASTWELAGWPPGYSFWVAVKLQESGRLRKDYYLYGGSSSPARF